MLNLTHRFVFTNGIRMHFVEAGQGPLVLLCHGWPETWYSWRHQIPALVEAGYRVVAPDQRGYGETDAPLAIESYDIANLVADLTGLVDALGETKAMLIGHDWGAIVTGTAALLRPDMFHAIGLLSVPFLPRRAVRPATRFELLSQEKEFYQNYFQQPGKVERELDQDVRRSLKGIYFGASGDARSGAYGEVPYFGLFDKSTRLVDNLMVPENYPAWLTEQDFDLLEEQFKRSSFRGGINWYRNMDRNWQMTPYLAKARLHQPTIFIAGQHDGVLRIAKEEFEGLEANVPNLVSKNILPGAGHWVQQERPEEVTRLLADFVRSVRVS